jgi:hypothetical protein
MSKITNLFSNNQIFLDSRPGRFVNILKAAWTDLMDNFSEAVWTDSRDSFQKVINLPILNINFSSN